MEAGEVHAWCVARGMIVVADDADAVVMQLDEPECLLTLQDAWELARILERHGRALWDAGVRDARPRIVELGEASAEWQLGDARLRVHRRGGVVALAWSGLEAVRLQLVPLVELIQVLDRLCG